MFKPCGAKVFSLQIHLPSWYLQAAAALILLCNIVTLRSLFKLWLSWKCFASSLLSGLFLSDVWRNAVKVVPLYLRYIRPCAWNFVQHKLFPIPCSFQYLLFFPLCLICRYWWVMSDDFIHAKICPLKQRNTGTIPYHILETISLLNTNWQRCCFEAQ